MVSVAEVCGKFKSEVKTSRDGGAPVLSPVSRGPGQEKEREQEKEQEPELRSGDGLFGAEGDLVIGIVEARVVVDCNRLTGNSQTVLPAGLDPAEGGGFVNQMVNVAGHGCRGQAVNKPGKTAVTACRTEFANPGDINVIHHPFVRFSGTDPFGEVGLWWRPDSRFEGTQADEAGIFAGKAPAVTFDYLVKCATREPGVHPVFPVPGCLIVNWTRSHAV